jgi:hypothetical protein
MAFEEYSRPSSIVEAAERHVKKLREKGDPTSVRAVQAIESWIRRARQGDPATVEGVKAVQNLLSPFTMVDKPTPAEAVRALEEFLGQARTVLPATSKKPKIAREWRRKAVTPKMPGAPQDYLTFSELAKRWGCSWGTVQNRIRAVHAQVLDFAPRGKRGKKVIALKAVLEIERRNTKRLR